MHQRGQVYGSYYNRWILFFLVEIQECYFKLLLEDSHLLPYQPWKWKSHCRDLAWKIFTLSLLFFSSISSIHESSSFIQKVVEISKENSVLSNSHLHAGIGLWWWSGPLRREVRGQELSACGGDFMREEIVFSGKIQLSLNKSQCKAKNNYGRT